MQNQTSSWVKNGDCNVPLVTQGKQMYCKDLKGMWELLLARANMTSPRADKDLLMFWVSLSRSPWTSVFATRSLPAKSTNHSLLFVHSPFNKFSPFTTTQWMLWKRKEKKLRLNSWSPKRFSEKGTTKSGWARTSEIGCCAHSPSFSQQPLHYFLFSTHPKPPLCFSRLLQPILVHGGFLHSLALSQICKEQWYKSKIKNVHFAETPSDNQRDYTTMELGNFIKRQTKKSIPNLCSTFSAQTHFVKQGPTNLLFARCKLPIRWQRSHNCSGFLVL